MSTFSSFVLSHHRANREPRFVHLIRNMWAPFRVSNRVVFQVTMGTCLPSSGWPHTNMDQPLTAYLRPLRRRYGFTQEELAFLIGIKSRTAVSRIEGSKRKPSLAAVYICALLFNTPPPHLFPDLMSELHEALLRRANELYEELQGNPSKTTRIKLDFLEQLLARFDTSASRSRSYE